ncbi:MAG: Cys-tRNA(Pro) deacylase [Acholeplasmatales bacterium]|jgi:Cys-tRNA(Pro)/Cys-tRNA(Cys) deacylase|nr:Cys-tRNA(Pro) deacylase [Acholeplasmatales bacterium]
MKNNDKTNVMRILDQKKINYEAYYYPVDESQLDGRHVADSLNEDYADVFKTLVCVAPSKKYYVFVVNIIDELDLKACARAVKEKSVEMIAVKDIEGVTGGYVRGGTSPIGMKKLYKTVIDNKAKDKSFIFVSGGKRGTQVKLSPLDLAKLINASFEDLRRDE